jgi:CHAT domain-containing protein
VPSAHPEPGLIAAHADGRLTGTEAAQLDEHLAVCSACYEVFSETLRFKLDEPSIVPDRSRAADWVRRPAFRLAAVLAVAATVLVAFQQLWLGRFRPGPSDPVAELARAMGTTRFIEPRLTGGFQHGRYVVLRSAEEPQGLDAYPPAVIAAVARVREITEGDSSPQALGAQAVTFLVSGDVAKAVKALESATAQDPKNPRLLSDLAAAYLVRASRLDEPSDVPRALEAADKAIELPGAPDEAWFNRALALEALHLVDAAKEAWDEYLERDSSSDWAVEARKRRDDLPLVQLSTLEKDGARAAASIAKGSEAVEQLADELPQVLRDYFDSELLYAWADAYLDARPEAANLKAKAELVGEALLRATGEPVYRDAARALSEPSRGSSRDPPQVQALGYKFLQEAQRLADAQKPNCDHLKGARRLLEAGGSPFALWARERHVRYCLLGVRHEEALAELDRLGPLAESTRYQGLAARVHWLRALVFADRVDIQRSLDHYQQARDIYRRTRDPENESAILARRAFVLQAAGDTRSAWRERSQGLALLDRVRRPSRRAIVLYDVANACSHTGLQRCARQVQSAVVETARLAGDLPSLVESLASRSALYGPDAPSEALADLREARRYLSRVENEAQADYLGALIDATEARALAVSAPQRAIAMLEQPIPHFESARPRLVPALRATRARSLLALNKVEAAAEDLEAGIRMLENQRAGIRSAALRTSVFDEGASLFEEMVALQLDKKQDSERALYFVERSRGRQLLESTLSLGRGFKARTSEATSPLTPEALRGELPGAVALVFYVTAPERLLSWVLTQEGLQFRQLPLSSGELGRDLASYQAALDAGSSLVTLRERSAVLFDKLVRPLSSALHSREAVLFIPDQLLQSLPFASLWDRERGRYLVEDYVLGMAPSGTFYVRAAAAAARTSRSRPSRVLAVGNPRLERASKLPGLPRAEQEASAVAGLYARPRLLTGAAATKAAFLSGLREAEVVHFAGHAKPGDEAGGGALLFASDRQAKLQGPLHPWELEDEDLRSTRVVVLAGCRTATGATSRLEGALSLARPFLAAGVPSVVASLRDVDDGVTRDFSVTYHRALLSDGDSAKAVRQAQLDLLRSGDPIRAHPSSWSAFVNLGGFNPHEPSQLARSR